MANSLSNLAPDLYRSLDVVSRELVGLIPSVSFDPQVARAAVGQTVRSFVAPAATASDITPGVTPPNDGDQTIGNVSMTIQKSRRVPVRWNGEESLGVDNNGPGRLNIMQMQFAQAMRTLTNEMEADLAALHTTFSRAYGTPGTTPFGTAGDFQDASFVAKILKDNGAPLTDMQLVIDTTAGAKMVGLQSRYDIAGKTTMQEQGIIERKANFTIRESAQIATSVSGTGASATTNATGYAVGARTITLASAGTGTIVAGDVATFAGDTNQYLIASGDADVSNGGTITLAAPGLRKAIPASATAITIKAAAVRNMAFARTALLLATRAPALPKEGDSAADRMFITDPRSGLTFEVSMYLQYRQVQYEIAAAWGVKNVKEEHTAILFG